MRELLIASVLAGFGPAQALACTPPADWTPERQVAAEDEELLRANFIFRGVIEELTRPPASQGSFPDVRIRRTRLFWGTGAPAEVVIRYEDLYYAQCPLGNLHLTLDMEGEGPEWPTVRSGIGVTVIGRIVDQDDPARMFILVDGAPGTQETLRRFARNLRNLER